MSFPTLEQSLDITANKSPEFRAKLYPLADRVKSWAMSESFDVDNLTFKASGNIESATLVWPDGTAGTISNVTESNGLITGIRYNYAAKYVELSITYDAGEVTKTEWTTNGF